jgi:hypothetical protein
VVVIHHCDLHQRHRCLNHHDLPHSQSFASYYHSQAEEMIKLLHRH